MSNPKPVENKGSNLYAQSEIIYDYNGKKHRVYPCPIKHLNEVTSYLSTVNVDFPFGSFMVPEYDQEGAVLRNEANGRLVYGITACNELLDVMEIAVRFEETREEIEEWLDVALAQEIIETLIGFSQVKKKKEAQAIVSEKN